IDGEKRYILAPVGLAVGDAVEAGPKADIKPGNSLALSLIPLGTMVHNVELREGRGGQLGRSAGTAIQLMAKEGDYALLKLPSGELRRVRLACRATIGQVGNLEHENIAYGKAGRVRWLGRRPKVRGMAMNPVDHPHGGGEGRSKGNHPPSATSWASSRPRAPSTATRVTARARWKAPRRRARGRRALRRAPRRGLPPARRRGPHDGDACEQPLRAPDRAEGAPGGRSDPREAGGAGDRAPRVHAQARGEDGAEDAPLGGRQRRGGAQGRRRRAPREARLRRRGPDGQALPAPGAR